MTTTITTMGMNKGRALLRKYEHQVWDEDVTAWYLEMTTEELDAAVREFKVPFFLNSLGVIGFSKEEILAWWASREIEAVDSLEDW